MQTDICICWFICRDSSSLLFVFQKRRSVKWESWESIFRNGTNGSNHIIVCKTEVSEHTHIERDNISEGKTDEGNIENNSLQYVHEDSQKQIISDIDESFSAS